MTDKILEVKKKKEFSQLPDSIILRALELSKGDIKKARAFLRKYFGIFMTNKVLKLKSEDILRSHISSKGRAYDFFYKTLFPLDLKLKTIIDLGCGVNGFSYGSLKNLLGDVSYVGLEATGQLVDRMNSFFKENQFNHAKTIRMDLFELNEIENIIRSTESPKAIFLFQVIDALEGLERNFSKRLLLSLKESISMEDVILITMPMKSISGNKLFESKRGWLRWFLEEHFVVEEFFLDSERIFRCKKL